MTIAEEILKYYPNVSNQQREIIGHAEGPLLVIAGPGSGKTYSLVLRTLNLLLTGKAEPRQILLCTFTDKAALEMRDRLVKESKKVGCKIDLSELTISTIHGFCNFILTKYRHHTHLGHDFETLDDFTQFLFLHEHLKEITGSYEYGCYLGKWTSQFRAINGLKQYFNKITEEMVSPESLKASDDPFLVELGIAYERYEAILKNSNRVDFAHLQKYFYDLLNTSAAKSEIEGIRYVQVDEYQDTNYIQEHLLLKLTEKSRNLCVVGDEDQSLYRFRGATVRNILEFPQRFPECRVIKLTTNYRSHPDIIERYDRWMGAGTWTSKDGRSFRYDKSISANDKIKHASYPSVFCIWGKNQEDETQRFAHMVEYLKNHEIIEDYSQVALLLYSVRYEHSGPYIEALQRKGIPYYCPRARAFFEIPEVRYMIGCYALIFGWHGRNRGYAHGRTESYVDDALMELAKNFSSSCELSMNLKKWSNQIDKLQVGQTLDMRPVDYLYRLLALEPFKRTISDENIARNLAILSKLLDHFQIYYHYPVITYSNKDYLRLHLFQSFLYMLLDDGVNEYEDDYDPFPKGHVQIMTIHQAKGLEFPVVVVGSLHNMISSAKEADTTLSRFYHRPPFEPEHLITYFDRMRLYYVAFSRPQNLLVLTSHKEPKDHLARIWEGLPQWPYIPNLEALEKQRFGSSKRARLKKTYSFTGDLRVYETCPRQYQFFREYSYVPSKSSIIFFGLLVHQTIEEIHRLVLEDEIDNLNEDRIRELFERTYNFLKLSNIRPIAEAAKKAAFKQVMDYFHQNRLEMRRIIQTEVDVSLEKEDYVLSGKLDLLLGGDGKLELLDFKTAPRPKNNPELVEAYMRQLCTYAHILEKRYGKRADRMMIYWTSEPDRKDALMVMDYDPESVNNAGAHFDEVVARIEAKKFDVLAAPGMEICEQCDLIELCRTDGTISGAKK